MTALIRHSTDGFLSQVADSFSKACDSYFSAARLQQQVALDALTRLPSDQQGKLLDIGCGPGWIHPRFCHFSASFSAVDLSSGMLNKAAQQGLAENYIQANAASLPIPDCSIDKIFSSLMLQWCPAPDAVFAEVSRVLAPGGRVVMTTLLDGTLAELKQAFSNMDNRQHVNAFLGEQQVMAAALAATGMHWQFERRSYVLYYPDVQSLARELKALGANQVSERLRQGLTGKNYWRQLAEAYETKRGLLGLPATYQVLIITGYKTNNE